MLESLAVEDALLNGSWWKVKTSEDVNAFGWSESVVLTWDSSTDTPLSTLLVFIDDERIDEEEAVNTNVFWGPSSSSFSAPPCSLHTSVKSKHSSVVNCNINIEWCSDDNTIEVGKYDFFKSCSFCTNMRQNSASSLFISAYFINKLVLTSWEMPTRRSKERE